MKNVGVLAGMIGVSLALLPIAAAAIGSSAGSHLSFCLRGSAVERAQVRRVGNPPSSRWTFGVPARVSISKRARARSLAAAVCALPPVPIGLRCLVDFSLRYAVSFTGDRAIVCIDPFGCQTVSGVGANRWAARTPAFSRAFASAVGLRGLAPVTAFRGHG
jgi:hypothetical protein